MTNKGVLAAQERSGWALHSRHLLKHKILKEVEVCQASK